MDFKNLTDSDIETLTKESEKLSAELRSKILLLKPEDMDIDKLMNRVAIINSILGPTRTSIIAAAGFVGFTGPMCGLSKSDLLEFVSQSYDVSSKSEIIQEMAVEYSKQTVDKNLETLMGMGNLKVH